MLTERKPVDWIFFVSLVAMVGTGFTLLKVALETFPPTTLSAIRCLIGAATLYPIMRLRGSKMPALMDRSQPDHPRISPIWYYMSGVGVIGLAGPFLLIAYGQQYVDSGLTGILVAFMPLSTLMLSALVLPGDHLTWPRASGFALGFAGICVLMGPAALFNLGGGSQTVIAQLSIVSGAVLFAVGSVIIARMPPVDVLALAMIQLIIAAIVLVPAAFVIDSPMSLSPDSLAIVFIILIGIFPTGIANYMIVALIQSAGVTFMSQINYLGPPFAVLAGVVFLGEQPRSSTYAAMALILAGLAVAQLKLRFAPNGPDG